MIFLPEMTYYDLITRGFIHITLKSSSSSNVICGSITLEFIFQAVLKFWHLWKKKGAKFVPIFLRSSISHWQSIDGAKHGRPGVIIFPCHFQYQ